MAGMFRRNKAKSQEKQWRDWAERFESMGPVAQAEAWNALDQEHRLYVEQQFGIRRPSRSETRAALDANQRGVFWTRGVLAGVIHAH